MSASLPSIQEIARLLGGQISGLNQVNCPGPGHSKDDRSLSVRLSDANPDGFVVYSHASDDPIRCRDHVRGGLGIAEWKANGGRLKAVSNIIASYDYRDEAEELLFQVVRLEPKTFRQRRPDGNSGWLWSLGDTRRVPYRLPEVIEAVASDHPIFIAEGEKAADGLTKIGVTATCSPHGAGKWRDSYSEHLKGADVVILPDKDDPGEQHAAMVAKSLTGVASRVRVLRLPDLPDGGDPFDWIAAGGTADTLWQLVERLEDADCEGFNLVCLADVDPAPVDWVWDGYLARGKLTLLGGDPDLGKSLICTDAAARFSKGVHWPNGARAKMGSTVFICSEDGIADTIRPRAEAAGADLGMLHVFESSLIKDGKRKTFSLQDDLDMLGAAIDRIGNVGLVCVDAITSYMGKIDSHRTTDVRSVLEPISGFAEKHGVAILGVTHPPKAAQGNALRAFTGSFAFVAAPRVAFFVTSEPETERRLLLPVKNNIGPKARGLGYYLGTKTIANNIIAPHVRWDDAPVDVTADQAIAAANRHSKDGGSLKDAKEFLSELLANGPVDAREGVEAAEANGISERTLKRARQDVKVKSTRTGGLGSKGGWEWSL